MKQIEDGQFNTREVPPPTSLFFTRPVVNTSSFPGQPLLSQPFKQSRKNMPTIQIKKPAIAEGTLGDPAKLPVRSLEEIAPVGPALFFAPHANDETLGCGGLLHGLRTLGVEVRVVVVSDGTMSHPNSRRYPAPALRLLRQQEALTALDLLNVPEDMICFWGLKDAAVPGRGRDGFDEAVARCQKKLLAVKPGLVVVPWRREPHPDHAATWQIVDTALHKVGTSLFPPPRVLEYPMWVWQSRKPAEMPKINEVEGWRLNIEANLEQKKAAIGAARSQTTNLIDDDPAGFRLSAETLDYFSQNWEYFLETPYPGNPGASRN
jgi:LmbE family N-acetylglucosaminyl deacetylase